MVEIFMADRSLSAISTVKISDSHLILIKNYEGPKLSKMSIVASIG
jgi:ribosome recycling factor